MPNLKKIAKLFTLTGFKIGLVLTLLSLLLFAISPTFLEMVEKKAYDLHFLSRGRIAPGSEVVIVAIDEKSVDQLGRWPWPRTRIAELVDRLGSYGAKVIAFDIVFSEPDYSSGSVVLKELRAKVADPRARAALDQASREADNDSRLAEALKRNGNGVLGYFFFEDQDLVKHRRNSGAAPDYQLATRFTSIRYLDKDAASPHLSRGVAMDQNIPQLAAAAAGFGYFNVNPDTDGTVRWASLAKQFGDDVYPHISLEAVRQYLGAQQLILNVAPYGVDSIQIGNRTIATDEQGRLLINFRGPAQTFAHYPVVDVLNGVVPADALKDKIVLIGATAIGIYDVRVTPYSEAFPGIEINANIIDNLLRNDAITRPDWVGAFDVLAIIVLGLLLSLVLARFSPLMATTLAFAMLLGYAALIELIFVKWRIWLSAVYPGMTMVLVFAGVVTFRIVTEERKKKEIKEAFSHYVSPALVHDLMKDPGKLVLGGEERRLSVLFSDIRGFTTISEGLAPQVLVKLMNDYLTPMTDIVLKHGGTVDKYMGDAIMAFWGAPVWQEDHPQRACAAALEMLERLAVLQKDWAERGIPHLDIGVGLSTGKLTVGNMGSAIRFDYTVMGDAVNLGSRLEGMNKEYGTRIIVPKFTYEDVKDAFVLRQLDCIRVKGKNIPIKIYELMAPATGGDHLREVAATFEEGLQAYFARDWDQAVVQFTKTLAILPGDGPASVFMERVKNLRLQPPPADWDGVYVMTKK